MKKFNLVVPISGKGQRMLDQGYYIPKPMLVCGNKTILEWSMQSIDYSECNLIFIIREEHKKSFSIDDYLKQRFPNSIISTIKGSGGATESVLLGIENLSGLVDYDLPLIVYCPDTTFEPIYKPCDEDFKNDGFLLTFKANSPNYSYSVVDSNGLVTKTVEKELASDLASVGVYCFKSTRTFLNYCDLYLKDCNNKESHICPIYNYIIRGDINRDKGIKKELCKGIVRQRSIEKIHIMGTPEEFKFFEKVSFKYFLPRKFALCSDHSGYDLKEQVKKILSSYNISFIDFGCFSNKDCDYNEYVKVACNHVINNKEYFGIGVCRSGQGVNICANKQEGIRACLITDIYHAKHAIQHNAGNFFSLSSQHLSHTINLEFVINALIAETFDGGRHQNRIIKNGQ